MGWHGMDERKDGWDGMGWMNGRMDGSLDGRIYGRENYRGQQGTSLK